MVINQKRQTIFIHIPKTAGESISEVLNRDESGISKPTPQEIKRILLPQNTINDLLGKHATAMEIKDVVGQKIFNAYFKFVIIRNPWDQVASFYNHLRKPLYLPAYKGKLLHPYNACKTALTHNFKDWVIEVYEKHQFQDEMCREKHPLNHFKNQHEWFYDNHGKSLVNYIGRYESLYEDLAYISSKTGCDFTNMSMNNKSQREQYKYYYDEQTIDIIARSFKKDIELFGYTF